WFQADFIVVDSAEGPQHTDVVAANKCRSSGAQYLRITPADLRVDTIIAQSSLRGVVRIGFFSNVGRCF
ncbi:unnamed protein product, partial [Cylicostephanus goldi]